MSTTKIDLSYLKTIGGNDHAFIKEMLGMILKSVPKEIENMQQHFDNANYMMMSSAAHKIKAPLQMITNNDMIDLIIRIETIGRKGLEVNEIPELLNQLRLLFEVVEAEIEIASQELTYNQSTRK